MPAMVTVPRFEVFADKGDEWRWRLRAANGEIVATSESYSTEAGARRGAADTAAVVLSAVAWSGLHHLPVVTQEPASG